MKSLLKKVKLNESTISMALGTIVIVVVGILVVNYFKTIDTKTTLPDNNLEITTDELSIPEKHIVVAGDDLWTISETYYGSGYNWTDIAQVNNLTSPGSIKEGQELILPTVEPTLLTTKLDTEAGTTEPTPESVVEVSPEPTVEVTPTSEPERGTLLSEAASDEQPDEAVITEEKADNEKEDLPSDVIDGENYTVVRGDNLWNIAQKAYGDGYKWVEIAKANNLANPSVIHAGNVFVLPR